MGYEEVFGKFRRHFRQFQKIFGEFNVSETKYIGIEFRRITGGPECTAPETLRNLRKRLSNPL